MALEHKSVHILPDSLMLSFLFCILCLVQRMDSGKNGKWREKTANIYLVDMSEPRGIAPFTTTSTQRNPSVASTAQALCSRSMLPWSQPGRSGKPLTSHCDAVGEVFVICYVSEGDFRREKRGNERGVGVLTPVSTFFQTEPSSTFTPGFSLFALATNPSG